VRILLAEDDAVSRRLLQAVLEQWGYDVSLASDGAEAWQVLSDDDPPSLAILDWVMPGMDGIEVCRRLRADAARPYVYAILLTGRSDARDVVQGLDAGADDYITKPFDSNELRVRLRAGRRILELQSVLLDAQRILRDKATHDPLTAVWNRSHSLEALGREVARSQREGVAVSVLMADLDHFKSVNDTFGHMAGDAVLREAARRIRASVRQYDVVGRYGGEEFIAVLPGCETDGALALANRIRAGIGETPVDTSEGVVGVTISIGAATYPDVGRTPEELIRAADAALYRAKRSGRDRVERADPADALPAAGPRQSAIEASEALEASGDSSGDVGGPVLREAG
jgi:two-component system, cell cycle response regulator